MELKEKRILVTGGANGIGKALAEKLTAEGSLVGVFDKNQDALIKLSEEYNNIYCKLCDVTDIKEVETAVDEFCEKYGCVDVLINNAAVIHNEMLISFTAGGLKKHDFSSWNNIISANLTSVFNVTSHVLLKMINKRKKGLIVNVSSIASDGNIGQSAYSASKAGINALTVTWAKELASMGIRVAGISPGFTRTETTMNSMTESVVNEWIKKTPVKRMACPAEIVEGIIFIIKNDFFNGEILKLDGGLRI